MSPPKRRMPISCEPCRGRKIRCLRARDSMSCCETCIRRGIPPSQCVFLGYHHHYSHNPTDPSDGPSNGELLARIRELEDLIRDKTTAATKPPPSPRTPCIHNGLTPSTQISSGQDVDSQCYHREEDVMLSAQLLKSDSSSAQGIISYGSLSESDTGHVQFNPHGSQWSSVLSHGCSGSVSIDMLQNSDNDDGTDFPLDLASSTKREDLLAALPPMRQCDILKDTFFGIFAPLFHILHNPTFNKDYVAFQNEPESAPLSWLALLYVILSISVTALDENDPVLRDLGRRKTSGENVSTLLRRYRNAAMQCLSADQYIFRHNMFTLQALVLLIYGINHTHGKTWALLGVAYNIATALGCHIDPAHFSNLNPVQREERRRCWAGLIMLYTLQNIGMGIFEQPHIKNKVRLPADIDDEALVSTERNTDTPRHRDAPTQMSYILFKFRLYHLCSRVCTEIFGPTKPAYTSVMALDREILLEQDAWNERYLADSQYGDMPIYHLVHLNILYSYSHQLSLLLHRPILLNHHSHKYTAQEVQRSQSQCIASGRGLLGLQKIFYDSAEFKPYRWYSEGLGSFYSFHAAVVLIAILADVNNRPPDYLDIRQLLEESLSIFEQMSDRSRICAKAAPILRHLLSTISESFDHSPTENRLPGEQSIAAPHYPIQIDVLMNQLQPHQWLSQPSMAWDGWDLLFTDQGVSQIADAM